MNTKTFQLLIPSLQRELFRSLSAVDFPKPKQYESFGKSYLMNETTNGIGEGIEVYKVVF